MIEALNLRDWIYSAVIQAPTYHLFFEAALIVWIVWLISRKSYKFNEAQQLSEKEKEELIAEWTPEPLVPDTNMSDAALLEPPLIDGKFGKHLCVEDKNCLNLATMNFLGFVGDERIEDVAIKAVNKYGVGSCGPRGFYGTFDVHLNLEEELATFMHCEEAVLYSYGFATIASAIPAYAKRGDIIFCDKGVNFAIQKGLIASRSKVEFFNHNDMEDLERLLLIQAQRDAQNPKKAKVTRRFLIVEGIYLNSGEICHLPKLMEMKWKYKIRIFIDESVSFGVLGKTGRGVTEHFNIDVDDVDMICVSLENAVASTGGFCCGRSYVVDHQRLSGLGYCFSASLPPLLAAAARQSLEIMKSEPERFERLQHNSRLLLSEARHLSLITVGGEAGSPIFHLRIRHPDPDRERNQFLLEQIAKTCLARGLAITVARYLVHDELFLPEPSIRIAINSELTTQEIKQSLLTIDAVSHEVLAELPQY